MIYLLHFFKLLRILLIAYLGYSAYQIIYIGMEPSIYHGYWSGVVFCVYTALSEEVHEIERVLEHSPHKILREEFEKLEPAINEEIDTE